jgi:CRP-like cAMP-binding protein
MRCAYHESCGIEALSRMSREHPARPYVQVANTGTDAQRLGLAEFRRILALAGALYRTVGRYAQATFAVIVQLVACNTSHSVDQRCARCLLNVHDSANADEFNLTYDDLASLLGVARPTLTECASKLQAERLIRYSRGCIVVWIDKDWKPSRASATRSTAPI